MPIEILLIEDNSADIRLTQEAFRATSKLICIHVVSDGVHAMDFLKQQGAYAGAPRPDIVLLDLGLPIMDGRTLLALIKKDQNLKMIPIFVVTGSESEADFVTSCGNGVNGYHRKPVRWEEFAALVKNVRDFWMTKDELTGVRLVVFPGKA